MIAADEEHLRRGRDRGHLGGVRPGHRPRRHRRAGDLRHRRAGPDARAHRRLLRARAASGRDRGRVIRAGRPRPALCDLGARHQHAQARLGAHAGGAGAPRPARRPGRASTPTSPPPRSASIAGARPPASTASATSPSAPGSAPGCSSTAAPSTASSIRRWAICASPTTASAIRSRGPVRRHGDCWEGLAAGGAIAARWDADPRELPDDHPAWALEAEYVALGILAIVLVASPQRIVVGGGVLERPGVLAAARRPAGRAQRRLSGDAADRRRGRPLRGGSGARRSRRRARGDRAGADGHDLIGPAPPSGRGTDFPKVDRSYSDSAGA